MTVKKKRGLGRLYKRFNGKEHTATSSVRGKFYLEYRINGVRRREPLLDPDGMPITTLRAAEVARERLLAPLLKMRDKEKLEVIKARIETTEDEYQELLNNQTPPLALSVEIIKPVCFGDRCDLHDALSNDVPVIHRCSSCRILRPSLSGREPDRL